MQNQLFLNIKYRHQLRRIDIDKTTNLCQIQDLVADLFSEIPAACYVLFYDKNGLRLKEMDDFGDLEYEYFEVGSGSEVVIRLRDLNEPWTETEDPVISEDAQC